MPHPTTPQHVAKGVYYAPHPNCPGRLMVYSQSAVDHCKRIGLSGHPLHGTYKTVRGAVRKAKAVAATL